MGCLHCREQVRKADGRTIFTNHLTFFVNGPSGDLLTAWMICEFETQLFSPFPLVSSVT